MTHFTYAEFSYYKTNHGNELDLILSFPDKTIAVECKATVAPSLTKGTYKAVEDVGPDRLFVAAPVDQGYPMRMGVEVVSLDELIEKIEEEM